MGSLVDWIDLWNNPPDPVLPPRPPAPAEDSSQEWDSQLTANENAIESSSPHRRDEPSPPHWSDPPSFQNHVQDFVNAAGPWLSTEFFDGAPRQFPENLEASKRFIRGHVAGVYTEWKIGITDNLCQRWWRIDCGYGHDHPPWPVMHLLYAGPTGPLRERDSSGRMEKRLIDEFTGTGIGCLNRKGGGGERASSACPHFCYVVAR